MKHTKWMTLPAAAVLIAMFSGCATHDRTKTAMVQKWEKSTAQAKLQTVDSLIEQGQISQAENIVTKCLQTDPEWTEAYFQMGRVRLIQKNNDEAAAAFEQAVALAPEMDQAWSHLGTVCFLQNRPDRALEAFDKALALKPDEPVYVVAAAQVYLDTNRPDNARDLLEQALAHKPGNRDLLFCMAQLHQQTGHIDKAVACYEQALLDAPKDDALLESLGYSYVTLRDWTKAADTFERLLRVTQDKTARETILSTLALCAFNAGRYAQALNHYDTLSTLRRDDPEVWLNMAQSALGADRPDRAADNARRAIKLKPSWPKAYAVLGSAQYLNEDYNGALRSFSYLRSDDNLSGFGWFMSGRCYARLGQTVKAQAAYQKAGDHGIDSPLISRFLNENPADAL